MEYREDSRGIGDLLGDLGRQVSTLVRKEMDLARVEVTWSVGRIGRGAAMAGAGGAILYAGLLVLLLAIVLGLIQAGVDAVAGGADRRAVVVMVIGGVVTSMGVKQMQATEIAPNQTAETVRENVEFVKEQIK